MGEKWDLIKKDRHLCNATELEKKYKYHTLITKYYLIPIIIFSIGEFYVLFFESSMIISVVVSLLLLFMIHFWFILYLLSNLDDKNLLLFLYLKKGE